MIVRELITKIGFKVDFRHISLFEAKIKTIRREVVQLNKNLKTFSGAKARAFDSANLKMFNRGMQGTQRRMRLMASEARRTGVQMRNALNVRMPRMPGVTAASSRPRGATATGATAATGALMFGRGGQKSKRGRGRPTEGSLPAGVTDLLAIGGIGSLFSFSVGQASRLREQVNVLNQTLGEADAAKVRASLEPISDLTGRGKVALTEFAASFASVFKGFGVRGEELNELSSRFTKMSVDLASFKDISDERAATVLRAGLAGETEPLRRLGIDTRIEALQEYAKAQGKNFKAMKSGEKTLLRAQFITEQLADADGDATRTKGEFANAMRNLKTQAEDTSAAFGERLTPAFKAMVVGATGALQIIKGLDKQTTILKSAFVTLGVVATGLAMRMLLPWVPTMVAVLAFGIVVDELLATFEGGKSLINTFFNSLLGKDRWDEIRNQWRDGTASLAKLIEDWAAGDDQAWMKFEKSMSQILGRSFRRAIRNAFDDLGLGMLEAVGLGDRDTRAVDAPKTSLQRRQDELKKRQKSARLRAAREAAKEAKERAKGPGLLRAGFLDPFLRATDRKSIPVSIPGSGAGAAKQEVTLNSNVTINAQEGASASEIMSEARSQSNDQLQKEARDAAAALNQSVDPALMSVP